jgi:hypothetical protein
MGITVNISRKNMGSGIEEVINSVPVILNAVKNLLL